MAHLTILSGLRGSLELFMFQVQRIRRFTTNQGSQRKGMKYDKSTMLMVL